MVDKLKALELYGKAMGYFADRRETTGAAESRPIISVEFVDPADHLPHPDRGMPALDKPRSIAARDGTALIY